MTAAYRMKGAGWLIACVAVVLGFYLVSLRVAAERKKLDQVDARVAAAQRDIRALETEFDTRANLAQLERWNGDTLSLAAPTAAQFVRSGADLASLDVSAASPLGGGSGAVRTAALVVPAAVAVVPVLAIATSAPAAAPAAAIRTAPVAVVASVRPAAPVRTPVAAAPAVVRVAAIQATPSSAMLRRLARAASAERARDAVALVRPRAVAMLDSKLLSDATLGSILSGARHEARLR